METRKEDASKRTTKAICGTTAPAKTTEHAFLPAALILRSYLERTMKEEKQASRE